MADIKDPNVQKVIDALNTARRMEINAIHQYMVQHYLMDGYDLGELCAFLKLIAVDEMNHAEDFAERIDALGGKPDCEMSGTIAQGQTVQQIYPFDIDLESNTIKTYNELAEICHKAGDGASAGLFNSIISDEEIHLAYYKETAHHIDTLGNAFLAKFAGTSKHTGPIKRFVKVQKKEKL